MLENIELEPDSLSVLRPADKYYSCSLHEAVKIRGSKEDLGDLNIQTIPQFFQKCCQKYKDLTALAFETPEVSPKTENKWSEVTYAQYERNAEQAALLLLYLGVKPHSSVSVLAFNCPEWFYVEMGAFRIGAVVTGIYTTSSAEAVLHILKESETSVCLVDDAEQMLKVRAIRSRLNQLKAVIQLNGPFDEFVGKEPGYYSWKNLFEMRFSSALCEELLFRESNVKANDCALIIFTSGTVGMPKGVMLSHTNILYCCNGLIKQLPQLQDSQETCVSYLPLNHIAAQIFDVFMAMENGFLVYFADRNALKGTLATTYRKAKGTILIGVPRVYEKMQEKVLQVELELGRLLRILMSTARCVMLRYHLDKMENKFAAEWKYWLASKIVHKIKMSMGLGHVKWCFVGGAPITQETKKFFLSLDLPLVDIFGMSETSGLVTYNFERPNLKTVGKAIQGAQIKIDKPNENGEGEILIKAPSNLMGYLNEPQKTLETLLEDGFLRTGDIGYLDHKGNLYISGRLKELIITAGGENIPPAYIEEIIKKELPCVSNAVVIGDQKKYLTVLLTLKTDIDPNTGYPLDTLRPEARDWLESLGLQYSHLSEILNFKLPENLENFDPNSVDIKCNTKVWKTLEEGVRRYNKQAISNAQKVQYFALLPHDFSVPTNELGPTLKIKRNIVAQKYAKTIDKMYTK